MHSSRVGGREGPLPFLFINMAGLGPQSQRAGAPGADSRLHQHGGHTGSPSSLPRPTSRGPKETASQIGAP